MPSDYLVDGGLTKNDDIEWAHGSGIKLWCPPVHSKHGSDPYAPRRDDKPGVADWRRRMAVNRAKPSTRNARRPSAPMPVPLPENRFCRSETNSRTLKPLFFHTANPRHRGIATERRALRSEQMRKLGGGRVRFRKFVRPPNPRKTLHQGPLCKWEFR